MAPTPPNSGSRNASGNSYMDASFTTATSQTNDNDMNSPFNDSFEFANSSDHLASPLGDHKRPNRNTSILRNGSQNQRKTSHSNKIHFSDSSYQKDDEIMYEDANDSDSIGKTPALKQSSGFDTPPIHLKDADLGKLANVNFDEDEEEEYGEEAKETLDDLPNRKDTIMKRYRWGTQRHKNGNPLKRNKTFSRKNLSIRYAQKLFTPKGFANSPDEDDDVDRMGQFEDTADRSAEKRNIFWNLPLPSELSNSDGKINIQYPGNKVVTTKYTPITFLPKNISFQFHNVANIYFLILIIMGYFEVFGVPNPELSMVPLIVIVALTAIKDAIEDSRRTILDLEVNNQITHVLAGISNPNWNEESVSLWRKFKKLNSKILYDLIYMIAHKGARRKDVLAESRNQFDQNGDPIRKNSLDSFEYGKSLQLNNNATASDYDQYDNIDDPFADNNRVQSNYYDYEDEDYDSILEDDDDEDNDDYAGGADYSLKPRPLKAKRLPKNIKEDSFHFQKQYWKNVHVGDIIKIQNNDAIPVDLLILTTSDADGACYVETKNLDGETNLKVKQALKCTSNEIRKVQDLPKSKFWLESEGPKANLYSYQGNFKYYVKGNDRKREVANEPVTINNMLLRGCNLRNTKWVVGMVVFTGVDTKTTLNSGVTPTKKSRISRELNFSVITNFVLVFVLCFVAGLVNGIYYRNDVTSRTYFEFGTIAGSPASSGILAFFVALILYQSLVPISLYISIEIIKTAQAYFIYSDVMMYNERLDVPCVPKSWNISDDLGQIEYIFSDKTGTLTQNVMEFKKCTINGVSYGRAYTEAYAGIRRRQGIDVEEEAAREREGIAKDKVTMIDILDDVNKGVSDDISDELTFISKQFAMDLRGDSGEVQKLATEHFMLALALCHSVLTEKSEKNPGKLELKAQSPDEAALVSTARDVGFSFLDRTNKGLILNVQGSNKEFQILNILEFNSTRKRMSAIIKIPPSTPGGTPSALLICKGADSIIYSRLSPNNNQELLDKTAVHLEQYATEGLRTLCIAQRRLTWAEYEEWSRRHDAAAAALEDRENKMEEVASSVERDLILLGGTAIEDRLQDGVPESIQVLAKAGIKLWVLTGDKVETAINIGFSCNLLETGMDLLVIKTSGDDLAASFEPGEYERIADDKATVVDRLIKKYLSDNFDMDGSAEELEEAKKIHRPPSGNYGVVIDGDALKLALSERSSRKFLLLCKQCKAVLCCRVSPAQKAAVVKLVKNTLDVMTLAIGDGSNDVAMIQAADVGVGIAGEEGRQAVMSSDYAIGQFRYLTRLVLVHGRWSYKRLATMIPCFFYKNEVFTIALFWYGIYSNFDGSYLFEYTYLMFYNLAFTSLPVIFLGIFDQDVPDFVSILVPQLYRSGILRQEWSTEKFFWFMVDGFYESIISFFFPYFMYYKNGIVTLNGLQLDHRYFMGTTVATIATISCDLFVLMHQYRWDWLSLLIIALSILIVFGWTGIWTSSTYSAEFYKAAARIYGTPSFWACLFIGFLICFLPHFVYDVFRKLYRPKDIDIIRECYRKGDFSQYPHDYDPTDPNRPKISNYTKENTLDVPAVSPMNSPYSQHNDGTFRDSINGTGGNRGSFVKRIFARNNSRKSSNLSQSYIPSHSTDTLATEEIEMEFQPGGQPLGNGHVSRPSYSVKPHEFFTDGERFGDLRKSIERRSMEAQRRSLEIDRQRTLERIRNNGANSDNPEERQNANVTDVIRTSLDVPSLITAEALVSRLSNSQQQSHYR